MDPSHAKRYSPVEIERIAAELLNNAHPGGVEPPIEIDLLVERHPRVDNLIPAPFEGRFNVDAVVVCKADTDTYDIFFDEKAVFGRISFSIAHEFGHVILHDALCKDCHTIEAMLDLHSRLRKSSYYDHIEHDAHAFAGAILMPCGCLSRDAARVYQGLVEQHGFKGELIRSEFCPALAIRYKVTNAAMRVRLDRLGLQRQIQHAIEHKLPMLDLAR